MAAAAHRFGRKSSTQALWPRVGHRLIASPCGVLARGRGDNFWVPHLRNCSPVPRSHQDLLIHLQSVGWWATSAFNKHHRAILKACKSNLKRLACTCKFCFEIPATQLYQKNWAWIHGCKTFKICLTWGVQTPEPKFSEIVDFGRLGVLELHFPRLLSYSDAVCKNNLSLA